MRRQRNKLGLSQPNQDQPISLGPRIYQPLDEGPFAHHSASAFLSSGHWQGTDRLTVCSWGHWEARTLWRVSILQHLIPLAGCPLSKIVLLWQLGKGSIFLWSFLMVYLRPFPLHFGLGLCARSLVSSLASLSFGSGLVLSANIFRVHGFLSSFWVEIWSLAPGFCLAFYFLHFKFQMETFSIIFNLTWCCTCQELWLSYDFSLRSMIGSP